MLIGLALAVVIAARDKRWGEPAMAAFGFQLVLNMAWSPVFFAAQQILSAFVLILLLDAAVLVIVLLFWRVRKKAGALLLPYLGWVLFATMLNWQFLQLNAETMEGVQLLKAIWPGTA